MCRVSLKYLDSLRTESTRFEASIRCSRSTFASHLFFAHWPKLTLKRMFTGSIAVHPFKMLHYTIYCTPELKHSLVFDRQT